MSTNSLTRALGYTKFKGNRTPRMLVLDSGYFLVQDVMRAAKDFGWDVQSLPTPVEGTANPEDLRNLLFALVGYQPDFLFTINQIGFDVDGLLAGILEQYELPLASWFVDHPMPILGGAPKNATHNTQLFCFERTALPWLRRMGYQDPVYLPSASNSTLFNPRRIDAKLAKELGAPLAFVGSSWWNRARHDVTPESLQMARTLAQSRQLQRGFLRDEFALLLELNPEEHRLALCKGARVALAEQSLQERAEFINALAELEPVVHGDVAWELLVKGAQLKGPIHETEELPAFYAGTDVNLNITATQMPSAVNSRVWDVPGAGGFLLTDAQEDLFQHFENDVDVVTFRSPEEALDKARFYLENESSRRAIAERAHQNVESNHRIHHRLHQIERVMRARF